MERLILGELQVGKVLTADFRDLNGRVLLKAGNIICDRHLKLFKMWGVTDADIDGVQRGQITRKMLDHLDAAALRNAESVVGSLFAHADRKHPAVAELYRLATLRIVRGTAEGEPHG